MLSKDTTTTMSATTYYDDSNEYQTEDGEPVPDNVIAHFAPVHEWAFHDPTRISVVECLLCGDEIYLGETEESCWFCGSNEYCGVSNWGEQTHIEHVIDDGPYFPLASDEGVMCGGCYESFEEYGDTLVIVEPNGDRYKVVYQGGVGFDYGEFASEYEYLDGEALELAKGIVDGTRRVRVDGWRSYTDVPDEIEAVEFEKVGGGWHSTMDRSEFSDRINEITSGEDVPPFPMAVRFGKTSNLFSINVDVFAPSDAQEYAANFLGRAKHTGTAGGISYRA